MSGVPSRAIPTFHHADFDLDALREAKSTTSVTVCLPARDEEATIGRIVTCLRRTLVDRHGLVDELLVVDDHSTDDTAPAASHAGARVVHAPDLLADIEPGPGKGQALWKSIYAATGDVIVWCDADIRNFEPRFVLGVLGPLLSDPEIAFVKGFYERTLDGRPGEGGRVTELLARPLLALIAPELTPFAQPLAGEYGGRRELLEQMPFATGYGVDLALLADVVAAVGPNRVAQVDLGTRVHRNRPLHELGAQSLAILQTMLDRAGLDVPDEAVLARPGRTAVNVHSHRLPPLVEVGAYRDERRIA